MSKQFDVVVGNPPYKGNLHLKMFKLAIKFSRGYILFVHPSAWLFNSENLGDEGYIKKEIQDYGKSFTLFNGNPIFNIAMYMPCAISLIDKTKQEKESSTVDLINTVKYVYDDIWAVNKFGNLFEYFSIRDKVLSYAKRKNVWKHIKTKGKYYVPVARVRGNVSLKNTDSLLLDSFYTLIPKDIELVSEKNKYYNFAFPTELMCNNFISYLKTKTARFAFAINKHGSSIRRKQLESIPWLDFSQEWTDKKLKKEFNITEKEWQFINRVIPDYY